MKGRAKILIVDDEADILESTSALLRATGFRTATLQDARRLAATIDAEKPDLILHDVRMPGIQMERHLAALRSEPRHAAIPLVLFSAHPDVAILAAQHDAQGYLAKPFDHGQLMFLLRRVLGATRASVGRVAPQHGEGRAFWNELQTVRAFIDTMGAGAPVDPNALEALRRAMTRLERAAGALERKPHVSKDR